MQKAVMLGNYEFYYGAGVLARLEGLEIPDDIQPVQLKELLEEKLKGVAPKDEKEAYLVKIILDFRPDEIYDEQMKELLLWGEKEERLWRM